MPIVLIDEQAKAKQPLIYSAALTLAEWLELIEPHPKSRKYAFLDFCFPTDELRQEYLTEIGSKSEQEVKDLLRNFLITGGTLGCDQFALQYWLNSDKLEQVLKFEYVKRMLHPDRHTWEGNTWVLDLLPLFPQQAIDAISAYILAHLQFLPDSRWSGLEDTQAVIRARYLDVQHPQQILTSISARHFELLVGYLYKRMGYTVEITSPVRDGGYDIRAVRHHEGMVDRVLIECKRYSENVVRVAAIRALAGVLDTQHATRGIFVTTSKFTRDAQREAHASGRIELVDLSLLNRRFNEHLGPDWPHRIDKHLRDAESTSEPTNRVTTA